jgi:hypothetical protein
MTFDLFRARQEGKIKIEVIVAVRGDQRNDNDRISEEFRISNKN